MPQKSLDSHSDLLGDLAQQRWRDVAPLVKGTVVKRPD